MSRRDGRTPTKFVLLAMNRSGSSWLMEMLNSHPAIGGYGELFAPTYPTTFPRTHAAAYGDPGGVPYFGAYVADSRVRLKRMLMPYLGVKYVRHLYAPRDDLGAIGFRLMYGHVRRKWDVAAWLFPYMALNKVRVIHLVRRNGLDLLVSRQAGATRNVWHARPGEDVPRARVRVDADTLLQQLDWHEAKQRRVRRTLSLLGLPWTEVGYEDLVADTKGHYRRVVEFLGVQPVDHEPKWRMRKVIDAPRAETIENYESVKRVLEGTQYASLLR